MAVMLVAVYPAIAGEIVKPLQEKEVIQLLKRLNSDGIIASFDKDIKKDIYQGWIGEISFFSLWPGGVAYCLSEADLNNDGMDEYILCTQQGSGGFFDIDAVYAIRNNHFVDIFNQIRIPLRRLVREAEKEKYDLEESYVGFMNGSIGIEKENGKVFFTLEQVTRKYADKGFDEDFNPPQTYKFLWENKEIKLIEHRVGGKLINK